MSDAFAYLSNDIILDVLQIGSRRFEDLEQLEETESNWGDVIRCGGFRKERVRNNKLYSSYFDYGLVESHRCLKSYNKNENWELPIFRDVTLRCSQKPRQLRNRILQHTTGRVEIRMYDKNATKEEHFETIDLLCSRPITELIYSHWDYDNVTLSGEECYSKLLSIPSLRCFRASDDITRFGPNMVEILIDFIKQPNFVFLYISDNSLLLARKVLEQWMQMTTLPKHMQCVQLDIFRSGKGPEYHKFLTYLSEQGLQPVRESYFVCMNVNAVSHIYYLDHPKDSSKRIEILIHCKVVELCLTSKEDSVLDEFSEYSEFILQRYLHENGPVVPPISVEEKQRVELEETNQQQCENLKVKRKRGRKPRRT